MPVNLAAALEKRLRLYLAGQTLPSASSAGLEVLREWVEAMPTVGDLAGGQDAVLQVSLTADHQRLTWRAAGEAAGFFPKVQQYLAQSAIAPTARALLGQMGEQLQPAQLGMWLELFGQNLDVGCFFPGQFPLSRALAFASVGADSKALQNWARQAQCGLCTEVGLSLGTEGGLLMLQMPLTDADVAAQLATGLSAFSALQAPPLPPTLTEALARATQTPLRLSVWLGNEGLAKVGLLLPQPNTELQLQLCATVAGADIDALAQFEGALGVKQPAYIECQYLAAGLGVELHYAL